MVLKATWQIPFIKLAVTLMQWHFWEINPFGLCNPGNLELIHFYEYWAVFQMHWGQLSL